MKLKKDLYNAENAYRQVLLCVDFSTLNFNLAGEKRPSTNRFLQERVRQGKEAYHGSE